MTFACIELLKVGAKQKCEYQHSKMNTINPFKFIFYEGSSSQQKQRFYVSCYDTKKKYVYCKTPMSIRQINFRSFNLAAVECLNVYYNQQQKSYYIFSTKSNNTKTIIMHLNNYLPVSGHKHYHVK